MIFLTRFDGSELVVNCDLIATIEKTPDTVITLTTGQRIMVREAVEEVVHRATSYRHRVLQGPGVSADLREHGPSFEPVHHQPPATSAEDHPAKKDS